MFSLQVLFLLAVLCGAALAEPQDYVIRKTIQPLNLAKGTMSPSLDLCPVCIQFTAQTINELLNIILSRCTRAVITVWMPKILILCMYLAISRNMCWSLFTDAGVVTGCEELCALLDEKVPSEILDAVCNLLCDFVGIKEFITLVEEYVHIMTTFQLRRY